MDAELRSELDDLKRQIDEMKKPTSQSVDSEDKFQLKYPLDNDSVKIIEDVVRERIMDIVWDGYARYFTSCSNPDEFDTTGTVACDEDGILLTTGTSSGNTATAMRDDSMLKGIDFTRQSRFRTRIRTGSAITSYHVEVGLGQRSAPNIDADGYGFYIEDDELYGFAQTDFSARTSTYLQDVSTSTRYELDARYQPNGRVDFFVDDTLRGSVSTNLPTGSPINFFNFIVETQTTAARTLEVQAFEFIQAVK